MGLEPSTPTATRSTLDQSLVDAAAAEIAAELAATEYQRQRAPEYPSLATLADALYWNSTGDSTKLDEYYAACAAVKAKYPKGGDS
jgi:streptomycin 6-kinase